MATVRSPVRYWQGALQRDTARDVLERFQLSDARGQRFVDVVVCIGPQRESGRGRRLIGDSDDGRGDLTQSDWAAALTAPGVWMNRRSLPTGPDSYSAMAVANL